MEIKKYRHAPFISDLLMYIVEIDKKNSRSL